MKTEKEKIKKQIEKLKELEETIDKLEPCPIKPLALTDSEYQERCKGFYIAITEVKYAIKHLDDKLSEEDRK